MSNPVFTPNSFDRVVADGSVMTTAGAKTKSAILLALCFGTAVYVAHSSIVPPGAVLIALFGAFILAMVICFFPASAPVLAPVYAILEGACLGVISVMYESLYGGVVQQAVMLTGSVFFAMLGAYTLNLVRPTAQFVAVVTGMTLGIALYSCLGIVMKMFGVEVPFLFSNGTFGIMFSLFVCGVASFNLIIDFGVIEQGAAMRAPKYMEWYAGFGLLVTVVWLYVSILRLLSKMRSR